MGDKSIFKGVLRFMYTPEKKTYIFMGNDHSGSMLQRANEAKNDYNKTVRSIVEHSHNIDCCVNVWAIGLEFQDPLEQGGRWRTGNKRVITLSSALALKELGNYEANGSETPLLRGVDESMNFADTLPDINEKHVYQLYYFTSDGQDNVSRPDEISRIAERIRNRQSTDRVTFAFRVPKGYEQPLINWGIPEGNIYTWDTAKVAGLSSSQESVDSGFRNYFEAVRTGTPVRGNFFIDLRKTRVEDLKQVLIPISGYTVYNVNIESRSDDFAASKSLGYQKGNWFYQLTKPEDVQSNKVVIIIDQNTQQAFSGKEARKLLGFPDHVTARIKPGEHGNYKIYIQSTAPNRNLKAGTTVVHWPNWNGYS